MTVTLDLDRAGKVAVRLRWAVSSLEECGSTAERIVRTLGVSEAGRPISTAIDDALSVSRSVARVLDARCKMAMAADRLPLRSYEASEATFTEVADDLHRVAPTVTNADVSALITAPAGRLAVTVAHEIVRIVEHDRNALLGTVDLGGACPAAGPDSVGVCVDWALAEAWGVSPRFLDDVAAPLASGHLPTWKPEWIEEARDWQPAELGLMTTLFTEWHETHGLTPHPDTWHAYTNYRDTPEDIPDHLAGGEFFPFVSDTFALDLATAIAASGRSLPGGRWPSHGPGLHKVIDPTGRGPLLVVEPKIARQMTSRRWTHQSIRDTVERPAARRPTRDVRRRDDGGRNDDPATAYIREDGSYVVVNDRTGSVVQISRRFDEGWDAPWD